METDHLILELLENYVGRKHTTNLGAWNVCLTDDKYTSLEAVLAKPPVYGHHVFVEQHGKLELKTTHQ